MSSDVGYTQTSRSVPGSRLFSAHESHQNVRNSNLGSNCAFVRLSDRVPNGKGLSYRAETRLHGFRTDLDAPSWQEIHALMIHGALLAAEEMEGLSTGVSTAALSRAISAILKEAGCPAELPLPVEADLERCSKRPLGRVMLHGVLVAIIMAAMLLALAYGARFGASFVYRAIIARSPRDQSLSTTPLVSSTYEVPLLPSTDLSFQAKSIREVPLLAEVNYQAFEFSSAELLLDSRHWVPYGPNEQAKRSAVIATKRFVGRKLQPIDEIRIYGATEGVGIDAECISGQPFRIEYAHTTGKPRVNLMKEYHIIVDISAIPTSSRFEVTTRMITWNGMKEDDPWYAFVGFAPIPECKLQLIFPPGRTYKTRKFVTYPPGKENEIPAEGRYKQLEREQKDQLYWEPKPIEKGTTYEVQWTW
jgi:hypothetical protein